MYFIYLFKNRTLKSFLSRGRVMGENDGRNEPN
jgi:hypothetical protein